MESNVRSEHVRAKFEAALNRQGYSFQYRILKAAYDLFSADISSFAFEVAEFPVEVQNYETKVDFILRRTVGVTLRLDGTALTARRRPLFLIAECKRANPSLSDWCFLRAPFTRSNGFLNTLVVDSIRLSDGQFHAASRIKPLSRDDFYQIAIEVKSETTGDSKGDGRGAIEQAAGQVMRGLNGLIESLLKFSDLIDNPAGCDFIPVIFTTANLWVSDVNLETTNLHTGETHIPPDGFKKVNWLFYQYNQSPKLKHSRIAGLRFGTMSDMLETMFTRTIPIVGPSGVENFFRWATDLDVAFD